MYQIQKFVQRVYEQYDLNSDDYLTFDEFKDFFVCDEDSVDFFKIFGVLTSEDLTYAKNF